jgi:hypothetical protein
MQLTIEIPDDLAGRLERESANLTEILERGLRQRWSETAGLAREVVAFLARGPQPAEILGFRPSQKFLERSRELLERSKQGPLSPAEAQELDEMAHLDHLVTLIKAEARRHLPAAA